MRIRSVTIAGTLRCRTGWRHQSLSEKEEFLIRAVDAFDPELWKNTALFSCWESSLQDTIRASHKQAQLLDLRWEWMEGMRVWAKPQRQTPNLTNKHRPHECQLGTQMYVAFSPLCPRRTGPRRTLSHYSCSGVERYILHFSQTG